MRINVGVMRRKTGRQNKYLENLEENEGEEKNVKNTGNKMRLG